MSPSRRFARPGRSRSGPADRRLALVLVACLSSAIAVGAWLHAGPVSACAAAPPAAGARVLVVGASADGDQRAAAWRLQLQSEAVPSLVLPRMPPGRWRSVVVLPGGERGGEVTRIPGQRVVRHEPGPWDASRPERALGRVAATPAGALAWGYLRHRTGASTLDGREVLVADGEGRPLISSRRTGGSHELLLHRRLAGTDLGESILRHGVVSWISGYGPRIGAWRPTLSVHVDDLLLSSDTWDARRDRVSTRQVRMTPQDLQDAAAWSDRNDVPLDMAINGAGASGDPCEPLLRELQRHEDSFRLVNHTFSHADLDDASRREVELEVRRNLSFARRHGLELQPGELVTGGHTGLRSDGIHEALAAADVRVVGTDASLPDPPRVAGVEWVPRLPIGLAFDAPTVRLQVDEWRARGNPICRRDGCTDTRRAWRRGMRHEAKEIVRHTMAGDPRPWYAHQANLAGDATLIQVLDDAVRVLDEHVRHPIAHRSMTETAAHVRRVRAFLDAVAEGRIPSEVPVTEFVDGRERVRWTAATDAPPLVS